jgi:hypothetical protein
MIVKIKEEFIHDYPEIDFDLWYEVKMTILDKVMLSNDQLYLKRKFDCKDGYLPR